MIIPDATKGAHCYPCRTSGIYPKKSKSKCINCGKEYRYYPSQTRAKFCSRRCAQTSKENVKLLRRIGVKGRAEITVISDMEIMEMWGGLKSGKYTTKTEAVEAYGLKKINHSRVKRLVGWQEYQKVMTEVTHRPRAMPVGRSYRKGIVRERQAVKELKEQGYSAIRVAGSKGLWDVWAFNEDILRLIQVKATKSQWSAQSLFGREIQTMQTYKTIGRQELWIWRDTIGWEKLLIKQDGITKIE